MVNQPHVFKHRDVTRLVKAARAAGIDANQVTVDPRTGAITVSPAGQVTSKGEDAAADVEQRIPSAT